MDEFLGKFGKAMIKELAREVAKELRAANDGQWISQDDTPIAVRVHCELVRRRVARGMPDAMVDGERYLMTKEAMVEEMRLRNKQKPLAKTAPEAPTEAASEPTTGVRDRLMRKLGRA